MHLEDGYYWIRIPRTNRATGEPLPVLWELGYIFTESKTTKSGTKIVRKIRWFLAGLDKLDRLIEIGAEFRPIPKPE